MLSVRLSVAVVAAAAVCAATTLLVLDLSSTEALVVAAVFAVALLAHHGFTASGRVFVGRAAAAHEEARATQERLRHTLRRTGSAVWEYDRATSDYVWTENLAAVVGETDAWAPLSATESRARLEPADGKRYGDALAALPDGGSLVEEVRVTWPDGSVHWLEIDAEASEDGLVRGLTRIIDARKQADAEREAVTDRALRTLELLEQINDAFLSIDRGWRIVYVNRAGEHYLRRTRDLLVGKNIFEEYPDLEGGPIWSAYHEAMNGPEPVHFEVRYEPLDMLMEGTAYPTPEGISVVYRDVKTERQLEEQLRQSQKMEAVGQLAGGIAHDFNNLLTAINGNTELGLMDPDLPDSVRPLLEDVALAGARANDLTRQLLAFSRQEMLTPQVIALNDVVVEAESLIRRLISARIEVLTCLDPSRGHVHADPGRLSQVVLNLAVNARDAMPDGGTLRLDVQTVETDGDPDVPDGTWARLSVSDTGCGMAPETVTRIFEPFFTTKPEGKGTGLGLSTVFGIVHQSTGHVTVETAVGAGTAFHVWLPLTAQDAVPEPADARLLGPGVARP